MNFINFYLQYGLIYSLNDIFFIVKNQFFIYQVNEKANDSISLIEEEEDMQKNVQLTQTQNTLRTSAINLT